MRINIAAEGITDIPVIERLLTFTGHVSGPSFAKGGKVQLDKNLSGYNSAAKFEPWLVLRDLDRDAECAPSLRDRLLPHPSQHMRFRIPVRAIEAWLLADREQISAYLRISTSEVPITPDNLADPKGRLIELARKSRRKAIKVDMVPRPGSTARVGPGYSARIIEFASTKWRPEVAEQVSESLRKCISCLKQWKL